MEHIFTLKERLHSSIPPENNGRKLLGPLKLREIFRYQKDQWKKLTRLYAVISNFSRFFLWKKRWEKIPLVFWGEFFIVLAKTAYFSTDILPIFSWGTQNVNAPLPTCDISNSFQWQKFARLLCRNMLHICASAVQKYAAYFRQYDHTIMGWFCYYDYNILL